VVVVMLQRHQSAMPVLHGAVLHGVALMEAVEVVAEEWASLQALRCDRGR
jgi:hypothetical protein